MYLDAIQDADSYTDKLGALNDRAALIEEQVTAEITELLTVSVTKVSPKALSLPRISYKKSSFGEIDRIPVADVVSDECSFGKPLEALMNVIGNSTCPLVAELRMAIAQRYIDGNAVEIAEFLA